jgi:hypothetical protein
MSDKRSGSRIGMPPPQYPNCIMSSPIVLFKAASPPNVPKSRGMWGQATAQRHAPPTAISKAPTLSDL